jgi:hypothetical protein
VNNVGMPQLAEEQRPVGQLDDERPQISDTRGVAQKPWRYWVDRYEPRIDVAIFPPTAQEAVRLDRLTAQDAE